MASNDFVTTLGRALTKYVESQDAIKQEATKIHAQVTGQAGDTTASQPGEAGSAVPSVG